MERIITVFFPTRTKNRFLVKKKEPTHLVPTSLIDDRYVFKNSDKKTVSFCGKHSKLKTNAIETTQSQNLKERITIMGQFIKNPQPFLTVPHETFKVISDFQVDGKDLMLSKTDSEMTEPCQIIKSLTRTCGMVGSQAQQMKYLTTLGKTFKIVLGQNILKNSQRAAVL